MTGTIRRRGTKSWELKFDLPRNPLTGKRQIRYVSLRGTKREAQAELVRLLGAVAKGEFVDPSKLTLAEFLDRWERDWVALNVSPKTAERYGELLRHARRHLGMVALQRIRPVMLADLYATLRGTADASGLSARSVGHVHRVLHRAFGHAVQWNLVATNPAAVVRPPKVEAREVEILSQSDVHMVLHALDGRALAPIVSLALATGMRRGEILALRWKDIDLDRRQLRVEQSLEQTKGGLRFKAPKTRHGRRTVSLPASAVDALRAARREQAELQLALGAGRLPDDALVFGLWDGSPRSPNALTKDWTRTRDALGLPKTSFHAFRHTHASQLIAAGLDVLSISRRLGHGSPTITLGVYGHLFGSADQRAAEVIEAAFASSRTEPAQKMDATGGNPVAIGDFASPPSLLKH